VRLRLALGILLAVVSLYTRYAIMINKGYRLSLSHLFFYISSFIIATQLWSIWRQSSSSYQWNGSSDFHFETDVHANVHTLANEQCDAAFPELYYSLDQAVSRRQGRKVHIQDIEIREGRCMLRVMIYQGEVCAIQRCMTPGMY
jgi:protein glucosyltransferase